MNASGDAAEQVVRLSLEGVEVAAKVTGSAAKEIAAMLYTVLKNRDKNKLKGRQRLTSMLRSGKELKVFTVPEKDLKLFSEEAKRYGAVYCVLRGKAKAIDGVVDVLVRAEDAAKINRIVERFKMAAVDKGDITSETKPVIEIGVQTENEADNLLEDMLTKPIQKEENATQALENGNNSFFQKTTDENSPSKNTLQTQSRADEGITRELEQARPSVKEELKAIKEEQKGKETKPNMTERKAPLPKKKTKKTKEK